MGNTISPELKVSASAFVCIFSVVTKDEVCSILEGKSCATFKQGCIFLFARKLETARYADHESLLNGFQTLQEIHQI